MILGIGGVFLTLALFGGLSRLEAGRRRRMLREVTKATPVKTFDLRGELLPPEETSLGPVRYERIPAAASYQVETRQPRHVHNLETGFLVPLATAAATALCRRSEPASWPGPLAGQRERSLLRAASRWS